LESSSESLAVYLYGNAAKVRVESASYVVESVVPGEAGSPLSPTARAGPEPFVLASSLPILSPAEACRAAPGLELELAGSFIGEDGAIDARALLAFRDGLLAGGVPISLGSARRMGRVTPLPADAGQGLPHRLGPFETPVDACEAVGGVLVRQACDAILDRLRAPIRRHLDKRRALVEMLVIELRKAEAHSIERGETDILAAFQSRIPSGASEVELPDLYSPGRMRKITLDPTLPVKEQVRRRYKEVARLERSREALRRRIATVGGEVASLATALEQSEREEGFDAAVEVLEAVRPSRGARAAPKAARPAPRYRRFDLDERWFVLVGRNDRENDEITFRIASPEDVWMHAQHVPGSHVILRGGGDQNPPKSILEKAAAIAAFYSKARHSKVVPVIHTRRKYVRKFKGARPGQVMCEREKTIFIEPKEPDEQPRDSSADA
jgi:hypothetical protein